ncbi:MAG: hypothetical protein NC177_01770 [Ruminococcus flavefaciens]|nr:hypothetical protein [Ruminococcus flavefaciens]
MIENLDYFAPDEKIMEGSFTSRIFKDYRDDRLLIYLEDETIQNYAERCIEHFNSMTDDMIDEICHWLIESCHLSDYEDFELPELENVRDILDYCWFTTMIVDTPKNDGISYTVEGEGDWGEVVGFVIKNGNVSYVGPHFEQPPYENDDHYRNCI